MATLDSTRCFNVWSDGVAERAVLYALRNVATGDTADLSTEFSVLKRAIILGTTTSGAGSATVSGTVVTIPNGLNADAGYLLAWGASA